MSTLSIQLGGTTPEKVTPNSKSPTHEAFPYDDTMNSTNDSGQESDSNKDINMISKTVNNTTLSTSSRLNNNNNRYQADNAKDIIMSDGNLLTNIGNRDGYNFLYEIMNMSSGSQQLSNESQNLLAAALKNCNQLQLSQIFYPSVNGKSKIESILESFQGMNGPTNGSNNSSGNSTCSPTGTSSTKSCCTSPLSSTGNSSKTESESSRKSHCHNITNHATIGNLGVNTLQQGQHVQNGNNSDSFTLTEGDKTSSPLDQLPLISPMDSQQNQLSSSQLQDVQSNESSSIDNNFLPQSINSTGFLSSPDGKKCSFCNKTFTCASALRIHFRKHSGERPYKCKFCSKAFSQNGTLKRHYQTCKSAPHNRGGPGSGGKVIIETPGERTMNSALPPMIHTPSSPHPSQLATQPNYSETNIHMDSNSNDGLESLKFGANLSNIFNNPGSLDHVQLLTRATEMLKTNFVPPFKYSAQSSLPNQLINLPNVITNTTNTPAGINTRFNFLQTLANSLNSNVPMNNNQDVLVKNLPFNFIPPIVNQIQNQESLQKRRSSNSSPIVDTMKQMKILKNSDHSTAQIIHDLKENPLIFSCDYCNIFFLNQDQQEMHCEFHAKNAPSNFTCSKCFSVLDNSVDFQRHFLTEHS